MAIKQSSDYTAVQHSRKRLVMRLGIPFGNNFIAIGKTIYVQPFFISRPAAKTDTIRLIFFLKRKLFCHNNIVEDLISKIEQRPQ